MEPIDLKWAAQVLGAEIRGTLQGNATAICTDTRDEVAGSLFVALEGENTDGHRYVAHAFDKGAIAALVSREIEGVSGPLLIVPDTLKVYGDLAHAYRKQFDIPVVAITGSVGKTSTKEMLAAVLRTKYTVLATEKNYNNEVGVPRTLFHLTREHGVAIVEMGMRGLNQIDRLAEIAAPTIGVITRIGFAHIELLGTQERIALAKSELLARLPADGVAVLPIQDPFCPYLRSRVPAGATVLTYGEPRAEGPQPDIRIYPSAGHPEGYPEATVMVGQREAYFAFRALGSHLLQNAGAALAVASLLGVPLKQAAAALETWEGAPGRMVARHMPDGLMVLDDCYNASPESMLAALETLAQLTRVQGVAVLGDMRELGDYGPEIHRIVGRKVVESNVRLLITVGELAAEIAAEAERYAGETGKSVPTRVHFPDSQTAAQFVGDFVTPKDIVLVKGSNAMKMVSLVEALTGESSQGGHG